MKKALREKETRTPDLKTSGQRLTIKQLTDNGTFEGYGSVFGVKDTYSEIVAPGAFLKSLEEHRGHGTLPAMLWQHDPRRPIGVYTEMREDEKGLYVKGQLALETQHGKEAHNLLKMGALNGLSIGFMPVETSFNEDTKTYTLTEVDLWEVSLVTFPANGESRIENVKGAIGGMTSLADAERFLRDAGLASRSQATAIVAKIKEIALRQRDADHAKSDILTSSKRLLDIMTSD